MIIKIVINLYNSMNLTEKTINNLNISTQKRTKKVCEVSIQDSMHFKLLCMRGIKSEKCILFGLENS